MILGVIVGVSGGVDAHDEARRFSRVRGVGPEMHRLIHEADAHSGTFRRLVDEIQQSNGIVFVQFGLCAKGRFRSCVVHVEGDPRERSVRIVVNTRTTQLRLMATIAHELHHAAELLRDPAITDAAGALALYRRIGKRECRSGLSDACESDAALETEARVLDELHRASRP